MCARREGVATNLLGNYRSITSFVAMASSSSSLSQELEQSKREIDGLKQELKEKTELAISLTCAKRALDEEVESLKALLKKKEKEYESLRESWFKCKFQECC